MANERIGDEPLTVSIGEQLQAKQERDRMPEGAAPAGVERPRERAVAWLREHGRVLAIPAAGAGGLVLGLLAGPRKKGMPVVVPLLAGWLVWRRLSAQER